MKRNWLTPDERAEWDEIYEKACYDDDGNLRSTPEAGQMLMELMLDAEQANRGYATAKIEEMTRRGFAIEAKNYQNRQKQHKTIVDNKVVVKKDAVRLKRGKGDGLASWETFLIEDADESDLIVIEQQGRRSEAIGAAEARDARTLIDLLHETGEMTVGAALKRAETTLEECLVGEAV